MVKSNNSPNGLWRAPKSLRLEHKFHLLCDGLRVLLEPLCFLLDVGQGLFPLLGPGDLTSSLENDARVEHGRQRRLDER